MLVNGETGYIIATRNAAEMAARLSALNNDRELAASMIENLWHKSDTRDWSDVGKDFLKLVAMALQSPASAAPPAR